LKDLDKTAAELAPEVKNRISHRGIALGKLVGLLREGS
jgi:inosine/xanthosine triphosphate pyrophosphatase family protein